VIRQYVQVNARSVYKIKNSNSIKGNEPAMFIILERGMLPRGTYNTAAYYVSFKI